MSERFWQSLIEQAPTVFVMLWIFSQLRKDVMVFMQTILRLLEQCMADDSDNDAANVKNGPD